MAYRNYQDVALGLSYALALERETKNYQLLSEQNANSNKGDFYRVHELYPKDMQDAPTTFAFLNQSSGFEAVFEQLSQIPNQNISQLNLWILAPGRRKRDYPKQIKVSQTLSCNIDTNEYYRIGIPYQLYRCKK